MNRILKRRLAAIEAKRNEVYQPVDMSFLVPITDVLEADRHGRLYSRLPGDHAARLLRYPPISEEERARRRQQLDDPMSPCGQLLQRMKETKRRMEESGDAANLRKQIEQARADTLAALQREQRERERRERQRIKKQRRKERKAAVRHALPEGS
jgi:hypothetical protein